MKVLGFRFCKVSAEAEEIAKFLGDGLGLPEKKMHNEAPMTGFAGSIFPAGGSWIEIWPEIVGMPSGIMIQIIVDDADTWAENATKNGLDPKGPQDLNGERIYYLAAPGGLALTFQSRLS